jgi:carnitine O-acetyltransferase
MRADPNTPAAKLEDPSTAATKGTISSDSINGALGSNDWEELEWGIRRATWLIYRLLLFKQRIDTEDIMPDASRAGAFCMHQYTKVFGITRIPAIPHDYNTATPHPTQARHLTVIARNNFYELRVLEEDGTIVPLQEIEDALKGIIADARKADGKPVGILTADGRDEWTRAREHLLATSPRNRKTINSIEDSLFSLCLDSSVLPLPTDHPDVAHHCTPASVDAHARNGSGAGRMGTNRWFDKAVSIIVEPNGRASLMGEHSPCDALIPSIVAEYALAEPSPPPSEPLPSDSLTGVSNATSSSSTPLFQKLDWDVDSKTEANIKAAFSVARDISRESDIGELWFDDFGTQWIKKVAKQSPDAFIQQVLQLAFSKVKGFQVPTYETASTRLFRHGRTDVIRSFSKESYELVKAVRQGKSGAEVYKLLSQATAAHNAQTKASSTGRGVDRHLTGLRLVYDAAEDGALPAEGSASANTGFWAGAKLLFGDDLLGESQGWKLSTSGLSAGDKLAGTGFGSGYLDGYGINYLAGGNLLKFGIESKHPPPDGQGESGEDPTHQLATAIVESLRYFKTICEKEAPPSSEGSKL